MGIESLKNRTRQDMTIGAKQGRSGVRRGTEKCDRLRREPNENENISAFTFPTECMGCVVVHESCGTDRDCLQLQKGLGSLPMALFDWLTVTNPFK